ncbi:hypothetical protein ONZ51_g11391 [Trametes cubensis]|uniref:Cytochrome P450 n=1 Tax=Trametes cubensis TaxID=1111947 RepID=A0AAD7TI07_9APHY|nr:hypothetical protein ONZ51_g11391 [Trametes cubensis]
MIVLSGPSMFDIATVLWTLAALLLVSIVKWCFSPIHAIPTVGGSSLPILSYFAGRRFRQNARELLQEGYKKYYGSVFKVAMTDQWIYVASGPRMIEEIRSWRDDELSLSEALSQNFQMKVIMGSKVVTHSYHIDLVKNELTDNIKEILPDLIDELSLAVPEYIPTKGSEWTKVQVLATMRTLLARISNRVFVGAPACRNKEYLGYATSYTTKLIKDVKFFRTIPWIPKPIAAWLFSDARKTLRKGVSILKPMIDERKAMMAKWGDGWQDKPNDFLQWILDIAVPEKETDLEIARRTRSTSALYVRRSSRSLKKELDEGFLRENVEGRQLAQGDPARLEYRHMYASALQSTREDCLLTGLLHCLATMRRRTLKYIKLHDGTVLPRDTLIMAATDATHTDDAVYDDADRFDPFRFARMREAEGDATKHQFVHTSVNYLPFGHGRHACPGRFFVAYEMKALLSYVLLNYDFTLSDDGPWTPSYNESGLVPPLGSLLFKKRENSGVDSSTSIKRFSSYVPSVKSALNFVYPRPQAPSLALVCSYPSMLDTTSVLWALAAVLLTSIVKWRTSPMHAVPTVGGSSLPILSYFAGLFKVAMTDQWLYVVSGPSLIEEIRSWRVDELSLSEALADSFQSKVVVGTEVANNRYHVGLIKNELTHNIQVILPDIIDELSLAVPEYIPTKGSEWAKVPVRTTMQRIVARASSRVFVGPPACRNQEYLDCAISYANDFMYDGKSFQRFPRIFKPVAALLFSNARQTLRKSLPILKPMIDERKVMMAKYGDDWQDKPSDLLQWILDIAVPGKETDFAIAARLMSTNLASIHSTSICVTIALFLLAQNPEYVEPLRAEVQSIIEEEGWTKASFGRMWKLDSLLKEVLRHWSLGAVTLLRRALKDIKLRDGTVIPRGATVVAATDAMQHDGAVYDDAERFDPFRFARMREAEGEATKHQFVHTSVNYLPFGHGKHACPGRFFVANEIKSLLSYLLLNYDFKLSDEGPWIPSHQDLTLDPPAGSLLFRKRETSVHY